MYNLRPIADSLPKITEKALGKKGTLFAKLLLNWRQIVGDDMANRATPLDIRMHKGKGRGKSTARLHLSVGSSSDAFILSYDVPALIEKINMFFGYEAVEDIKLIHAPHKNNPEKLKSRLKELQE